ncbi:L-gulonolactone oxidase 2-like [Tasmannia lanceolata]|uniref:L-gulonolactone oxidase 2-like n=1 Tax=Tasmannia lanceolata TaxID=3420 RepID=UPI0040633DA4
MASSSCIRAAIAICLLPLLILITVSGTPPGDVINCTSNNINCIVTNGYGAFPDRSTCHVAAVSYPTDENELLLVVSNASMLKQKMKVLTLYSHSIPKLSCPGGPSGAGLVISTKHLNRTVNFDPLRMTMTVEAGITLHELIDAAAEEGLAVPHSPLWLGVTLGGLLSTGSHGSSIFGKGGALHEYVVGMRLIIPSNVLVNGYYARIVSLGEDDPDLLAAKVSLGVLGVISQVTLQLQPMFKRSVTNKVFPDTGFENTITNFGATTEYGELTWYPSQARVVYKVDFRVPVSTPGEGENDFIGFQPQPSLVVESIRAIERTLEATQNPNGKCLQSTVQVAAILELGTGLKNNDEGQFEFTGYPVIGNQSKMMASGSCLSSRDDGLQTVCPWDPRIDGLFYHQTTISIPLVDITAFFVDVKKLRDMNPTALCGTELYYGFLLRFVRNSTAYLGKIADALDVDMTYYRSKDPNEPRLYEDVLEEIEQMALFKYNGLPHWGKNRNIGFQGVMAKYGSKGENFIEVMERYDPDGLFSSEWTDGILGLRGMGVVIERKGCALEGLCICSLDEHCAPEKGYYCRPGIVYTEARVCRKVD